MAAVRVLLIDDEYSREELNEPLGIEVLASALQATFGDQVEVRMECLQLEAKDLRDVLQANSPHVVGLSTKIHSTGSLQTILRMGNEGKNAQKPLVVLGGVAPTLAGEELAMRYPEALCVVGEGEQALIGLVDVLLRHQGIAPEEAIRECIARAVPNLAAFVDGGTVCTRRSVVGGTEGYLRPNRRFSAAVLQRGGLARIEGSRGCPWSRCAFCVVPWKYAGTTWRPFLLDKIMSELVELSTMQPGLIFFTDEEVLGPETARMEALCDRIIYAKRSQVISRDQLYYASTSVRAVLGKDGEGAAASERVLKAMMAAGFIGFFVGIESGSNCQLSRYRKGTTAEENAEALELLSSIGFETDIGFIMFDPEVSIDELRENVRFMADAGLVDHQSRFGKSLRLVPRTALVERYASRRLVSGPLDLAGSSTPGSSQTRAWGPSAVCTLRGRSCYYP